MPLAILIQADQYKYFGKLNILVNNAEIFLPETLGNFELDLKALARQQIIHVDGVVTAVGRLSIHEGWRPHHSGWLCRGKK
ncbi:putative uncharacterized protein [Parachlamydia acanthamoebae UV-7]|uniref:Uncharacterized protein n=2 Tax=Parachlamydia acanthamoebae TaxID=83552 RepID=F8KXL2_PARAV|nr:hypothetical protein [Parachlamydia acanthamoebae]KIA76951.1 hypothetical protein DB43_HC00160 [Parachlamydia acanthamoebae]CCB87354.1 putative uncharacterized protein [Parachlamydia acanthamoebae UV-7]